MSKPYESFPEELYLCVMRFALIFNKHSEVIIDLTDRIKVLEGQLSTVEKDIVERKYKESDLG